MGMTENEAIERIKYRMLTAEHVAGEGGMEDLEMAIKALEEIQQYRAIDTVEECRAAMGRWIDADAVMKQLEEHFNATNDKGARLAYHHAIKIVKGGGVDG